MSGSIFGTFLFYMSGIHINTWKYSVCSIKHEVIELFLHEILSKNIFMFSANKLIVHNF